MSDTVPSISPIITVDNPLRGAGTQARRTFAAQSMTAAFAWGSQPGSATIVYVGSDAQIQTGAYIELQIGALLFCGICKSDVEDNSSGGGLIRTLQFIDLREYLQWDYVFCAFNRPDVRLVNGIRQKRYWHIFPEDFDTLTKTFTPGPLMAWEIMQKLFNAPTVGTRWTYDLTDRNLFPGDLMNYPIYDWDALQGKRLDAALNEICEKLGCVFSLISTRQTPYQLVFTRKGYGNLPVIPYDSDNRRLGVSLSGHPTNVRVLGDRNLYQVMDVPLEPDWAPAWERFLVFEDFANDIYRRFYAKTTGEPKDPDDPEGYVSRQNATAQALTMTVGDYAAIAGEGFADKRKYAGRWRNDMPAALYIKQLVFRAFRPAANFNFVNAKEGVGGGFIANRQIPLTSLDIADRLLCRCRQDDPLDGTIQYDVTHPADGNGYAIIQGYQVGADLFQTVSSSQFTLDFFQNVKGVWQHVCFQIDDSGEGVRFIIFDEPVFVSDDLAVEVNGHAVINADFTLRVPPAKAALVFEAERFSHWVGTWPNVSRDTVENVGGLNAELIVDKDGYTEVLYANNQGSQSKAEAIGQSILLRQYTYTEGAHKWIWNPATTAIENFGIGITSMIDRVVIKTSPMEGTTEVIDYTNERARNVLEPEREFERRTMSNSLFPGQHELRIQSEYAKKLASAFKQLPNIRQQLSDLLNGKLGPEVPLSSTWFDPLGNLGANASSNKTMPAGMPLRRRPTDNGINTVATTMGDVTNEDNIFMGVSVRHDENPNKPFTIQTTGPALALVKGPVKAGDSVGLSDENSPGWSDGYWDYLQAKGVTPVGTAKQDISDSSIKLIEVDLGSAGSSSGESGTYVLKDVHDDYLVCGPMPTIPVVDPPLGPNTNYLGTFRSSDFDGNKIILSQAYDDNSQTPPVHHDAVKHTPLRNDTCYDSGQKWFYIFDGTDWIEMEWDGASNFADWEALDTHTNIYIAKEVRHRCSLLGEKVSGANDVRTYTYTYTEGPEETWITGKSKWYNATRVSTISDGGNFGGGENQQIIPQWGEMELITAEQSNTGVVRGTADGGGAKPDETGTVVTLQIKGRTCMWAEV